MDTEILSQGTAHLHLVLKLQMSGATPLLPLHAFMVWTAITKLLFLFYIRLLELWAHK